MSTQAKPRSRRHARRLEVQQLLQQRDLERLDRRAEQEPNTISALVGLLNERDDLLRWRAIEALGRLSAARASEEPTVVLDLVRRQLWSMNDESGNIPWHAAEAIGEILVHVEPLCTEFASVIASHHEMPIFRAGVLWAVARIAERYPQLLRDQVPMLLGHLADETPLVRAHAALALGRLGRAEDAAALEPLLSDPAAVQLYDFQQGQLHATTVGQLAAQAARALGG